MSLARLLGLALLAWAGTAGPAAAWWNGDWRYRKPIAIDPAAAQVRAPAGRALLLVRLHSGNFDFLSAKEDGSDLRFVAGDDATPLTFHVERYDNLFELGLIWVDLPAGAAAAPGAAIWAYWGNPDAPPAGDPAAIYPPSRTLVWHFAETGPPADATAYGHRAAASTALPAPAYIGQGAAFDGAAARVEGPPPGASPGLAVPAGGAFAAELWLQAGEPRPNALLLHKAAAAEGGPPGLKLGLDGLVPFVEVDTAEGPRRVTAAGAVVAPGRWHRLAVTAGAGGLALYLDGRPAGSAPVPLPALAGPLTLGGPPLAAAAAVAVPPPPPAGAAPAVPAAPADAGADAAPAEPPAAVAFAAFQGALDELRLSNAEPDAAELAFAAAAETAETRLVAYGPDEERGGIDLGHFGPIVANVTVDGWVVIALCGVLLVLSWVVMVTKAAYVNGASSANALFLRAFRSLAGDLLALERGAAAAAGADPRGRGRARFARAPLYRLYRAGSAEVEKRVNGRGHGPAGGPATDLSPQSIAAIRAVLDAVLTREMQRANRYMVLLTIAISGGPFLGLLGTVVGVMITFAALAESGQVNINTIAPGISAALLATVAGLAVAIPALFGYNYLVGRIRDVANDMQVFVDEFTTRLAEQYSR